MQQFIIIVSPLWNNRRKYLLYQRWASEITCFERRGNTPTVPERRQKRLVLTRQIYIQTNGRTEWNPTIVWNGGCIRVLEYIFFIFKKYERKNMSGCKSFNTVNLIFEIRNPLAFCCRLERLHLIGPLFFLIKLCYIVHSINSFFN